MLEKIRENVARLVAMYENERQGRETLSVELRQSEEKCEAYRKQIAELKAKVDNLTLAQAFSQASSDRAEARAKIDGLVREIDKCISLLDG